MNLAYRFAGSYRSTTPESTLARFLPRAAEHGITRLAEITHLDSLGIPAWAAIRPASRTVQVANGKGWKSSHAKVSALMEAIELHHAENPPRLHRASLAELQAQGTNSLAPRELHDFSNAFFSDDYRIEWVAGEDLVTGKSAWLPASHVYFGCSPSLHRTSSNGLASGNDLTEATLHALYELVEREAVSRLFDKGALRLEGATVIDPATLPGSILPDLVGRISAANLELRLLRVSAPVAIEVVWAILLDPSAQDAMTTLNMGWGAQPDFEAASIRAITEAAQTRLAIIHGARENIIEKRAYGAGGAQDSKAFAFFRDLPTGRSWQGQEIEAAPEEARDLDRDLEELIDDLRNTGFPRIYRVDLSRPPRPIPVVKLVVPGFGLNASLFG
ncbi:MAG: YcaO-like family protein [Candidatus Binatia bacterium]|nr:YcaO-like family protein [Candidatus Binatia bacterium]